MMYLDSSSFRPRRSLLLLTVLPALGFIAYYCTFYSAGGFVNGFSQLQRESPAPATQKLQRGKELVVASIKGEDTSWLAEHVPDWQSNIYVTNDPSAELTVPVNKGREAMVYLTFIIDNYFDLPEFMVFMHSQRYQWHNDDPIYDGVPMLRNLQLPHLSSQGYVNLRCVWVLGCPSEIVPGKTAEGDPKDDRGITELAYTSAFSTLFPNTTVPESIGVSCCAQFALTRDKVLERPREDYERYREWLLETPLADAVSGRILEYSWHMMFGMPAVHCPDASSCYCKTFGLCNLTCTEGSCNDRYTLPKYSTLPKGWPEVGWGE